MAFYDIRVFHSNTGFGLRVSYLFLGTNKLTGNWAKHRECHIQPDWLLIYSINEEELILELSRTGTHSDLF